MQQIARFAVDAFDCRFQRGNGLVQILRLRIEEGFAFRRLFEFGQCRQIHRAQFGDGRIEAIDFGLIRGRARTLFHHVGEFFQIRARRRQLLRVIFLIDARFLLLHAQFGNLVAQRLQAMFDAGFLFFQALQFSGGGIHRFARSGKRFFFVTSCGQCGLQPLADVAFLQIFQLGRE